MVSLQGAGEFQTRSSGEYIANEWTHERRTLYIYHIFLQVRVVPAVLEGFEIFQGNSIVFGLPRIGAGAAPALHFSRSAQRLLNRIPISALRFRRTQPSEHGCFGVIQIGEAELGFPPSFLLLLLMVGLLKTAGQGHATTSAACGR